MSGERIFATWTGPGGKSTVLVLEFRSTTALVALWDGSLTTVSHDQLQLIIDPSLQEQMKKVREQGDLEAARAEFVQGTK